uniref:Robl_LC7 domain-containing protein n=1 Tax=Panagrellus redivivus TaxID=6233 RepID=A0A7E4UWI6_PANRE
MLKTRSIERYLEQGVSPGIRGVFLFNNEGHPVARVGKEAGKGTIYGALMVNIWETFSAPGLREDLQNYVLQNTEGTVIVIKISEMFLAVVGEASVPLGLLQAKTAALAEHLDEPLKLLM